MRESTTRSLKRIRGRLHIKKIKLNSVILFTYVVIYTLFIWVFYLLHTHATETTNPFAFPSIVLYISPITMILFGILINFERMIELINAKGKITVDWLRLVVIVLPLTPISFLYLLQYSQLFDYILLTYYIRPPVIFLAQFLQGFLLVSCFTVKSKLLSSD